MRQSVQELMERYQNNLFAAAFNVCKSREDAEDVVQDTFLQYHMNKKHWNSVLLETATLSPEHIAELVEASYDLVFAGLTKRRQGELRERHAILRAT